MHQAISGKTFDRLDLVSGVRPSTRIVQGVHDTITQGVSAAVRHGGSAALALGGSAERLATDPERVQGRNERELRGALNGVFGDSLAAPGSALAIEMSLHDRAGPLSLSSSSPRALGPRVGVLLHGLACDDQSWRLRTDARVASPSAHTLPAGEAPHYGLLPEHEPGVSALWLR